MNTSIDTRNLPPLPSQAEILVLAQDSKLVGDFARQIARSSGFLLKSEFTKRAVDFLIPHSKTLKECCDTQSQLELSVRKLEEIRRGVSEKMITNTGITDDVSLRVYREETLRALNSIKATCGSQLPSNSTNIVDLNALWREVETLLTRNHDLLRRLSRDIESTVTPFTQHAERLLDHVLASDVISARTTQLCALSSYYPRGLSPEAEAARAGMLQVPGDSDTMNHVLSLYESSELEASGQSTPASPLQGYFAELTTLKKQLLTSPSRVDDVLSELRDLYVRSGSTALAFYATLNCIAAGDTSHHTLFLAFDSGERLGSLATLDETLRSMPNYENRRPVLLQLYRIALRTGNPNGEHLLEELRTKHRKSAEKSFAEALQFDSLKQYSAAKEKAVFAWSHAKDDLPNSSHLALEAIKLAYRLHFQSGHTAEESTTFSDTVATHILKLNRHDTFAWEILCGGLFAEGARGALPWKAIDRLIGTVKSPTGAYVAGTYAHNKRDIPRTRSYLSQTGDRSEPALNAKIILADIAHSEGGHEEALKLLEYVSIWAPHHPSLPRLVLPDHHAQPSLPRLLAPQTLPIASWNADTRCHISNALRDVRAGKPLVAALCEIPQYARLHSLLQHDSALFDKCREAARELDEHVKVLRPLVNRSHSLTWTIVPWSSHLVHWGSAVHIHEALNPDGHQYKLGQLVDLLDDIERAASILDPWMQHFAPLRLRERLFRAANSARRIHGRCNDLYTKSGDAEARVQNVVDVLSEITKVRELLIAEVSPNLRMGKDILNEWTEKLAALSLEALPDGEVHEQQHRQVHPKIRCKEAL